MSNLIRSLLSNSSHQLKFWTGFNEYAKSTSFTDHFSLKKPQMHNWYDIPLKTSNPYISLAFDSKLKHIRISVYMNDKSYWNCFFDNMYIIEQQLGFYLDWQYKPETQRSYIQIRRYLDFDDPATWEECYQWFIDMAIKFKTVFSAYC